MKYLVLGASAAGINGAEELRRNDPKAEITLVSADDKIYSRCMLHYYISGHRTLESLNFKSADFFKKNNIRWVSNASALSIDTAKKTVALSNGTQESYDKLLIATGASSFKPAIPGLSEANNVIGVRTLDDCEKIKALGKSKKHGLVIGAGVIGMDILMGLLDFPVKMTVAELAPYLINRQLDQHCAQTYQKLLTEKGIEQHYNVSVKKINLDASSNPVSVELNNGALVPAEFIVLASGIAPNTGFLNLSGVKLKPQGGIVVNEQAQTNVPDIYAAGDVTGTTAIWSAAVKQAIIAASNMSGQPISLDNFFHFKTTMNFFDIPTMSIGIASDPSCKEEIDIDGFGNYKKVLHKNGKIMGALLQGDLRYSGVLTQLIKENIDVSRVKKPLFKIDYSDFFNVKENFEFIFSK